MTNFACSQPRNKKLIENFVLKLRQNTNKNHSCHPINY
uniref:Uncharacterized protein n=1 Tax=Rhizophora mucronata TaxID=61149 RepID=A0A2P2NUC5_RHIMU